MLFKKISATLTLSLFFAAALLTAGDRDIFFRLHTVTKGDTLAGIAKTYYRDPLKYKEFLKYNSFIKNPHWIFPGDDIVLPFAKSAESPPAPAAEEKNISGTGAGTASMEDARLKDPEALVAAYYPEDTENPLDFDYQGKIVDFPKDKLLYGTRDEAIVDFGKNLKAVPGQDYGVYRVYHKVFHPDSKEILGVLIKKVGRIRLTDDVQEYTAQGVILSAFSPLEKGDMVRRIEP